MLQNHNLSKKYETLFNKFNINTELRLSHFFAQAQHESGLKAIQENLMYSSQGLQKTFKKYFPTQALANQYARNPKAIASRVYANRMGNGPEASQEGYLYRGRGIFQITGKSNYEALTKWARANGMNVDYVKNPDLLLNEADSLIAAFWYWDANGLNKYADKDDVLSVSKIINLGNAKSTATPNGLTDRKNQLVNFKKIFKCK